MGRSPCCDDNGLKKGPWTPEEDEKLVDYIQKHGHGSWRALPKRAGLNRCGKSCRLRWTNYLRPDIKRGKFSDEEEQIIINLHSLLGNKWSRIAAHLPGRTDNEIKNFWNTNLRKKLLRKGVDPKTHKPISDPNFLVNLSQLLSAANWLNLMNPWDSGLRLQADATQLANIQLLQSVLQTINTSPLPNMDETSLLGSLNFTQTPLEYLNLITTPPPSNDYHAISNSMGFKPEFLSPINCSLDNININAQTENSLPALVSDSFETSFLDQIENNMNAIDLSTHSPTFTSTMFEAWEKLMDDEANCSLKDILE